LEVELGEGNGRDAVLAAQHVDQGILIDEGELQEDCREGLARALLLGNGLLEALAADQPFGDEEGAQALRAPALARRLPGQTTIRPGASASP
jgi:hypothetical protein